MKKIVSLLIIIVTLFGCSNGQIKTKEDMTKIESERNITNETIQKLVVVVKDRSNDKEIRARAFAILSRNDYSEMRSLLEAMLPEEKERLHAFFAAEQKREAAKSLSRKLDHGDKKK